MEWSWEALGLSWGPLGPILKLLGRVLGPLEAVLGLLGSVFEPLRVVFGRSWGLLCRTGSLQLAMGLFCRAGSLQSVMGSLCRTHSALSVFSCSGFGHMLRNTVVQYYWDGVIQSYITFSILH